jgi:hypothetical protein
MSAVILKMRRISQTVEDEKSCLNKVWGNKTKINIKMVRNHISQGTLNINKSTFSKLYFTGMFMKNRDSFNFLDRIRMFVDDSDLCILRHYDNLEEALFCRQGYTKNRSEFNKYLQAVSTTKHIFRKKCNKLGISFGTKGCRINAFIYFNINGKHTCFTANYKVALVDFKYLELSGYEVNVNQSCVISSFESMKIGDYRVNFESKEYVVEKKDDIFTSMQIIDNFSEQLLSRNYKTYRRSHKEIDDNSKVNILEHERQRLVRSLKKLSRLDDKSPTKTNQIRRVKEDMRMNSLMLDKLTTIAKINVVKATRKAKRLNRRAIKKTVSKPTVTVRCPALRIKRANLIASQGTDEIPTFKIKPGLYVRKACTKEVTDDYKGSTSVITNNKHSNHKLKNVVYDIKNPLKQKLKINIKDNNSFLSCELIIDQKFIDFLKNYDANLKSISKSALKKILKKEKITAEKYKETLFHKLRQECYGFDNVEK